MQATTTVCPLCGYAEPWDFGNYEDGWECCFGCHRVYDYAAPEATAEPMVAYKYADDDSWIVRFPVPAEGEAIDE